MKLHQVHHQKAVWHGEGHTLVLTSCGKRVLLRDNRQRVTDKASDITCFKCRRIAGPRREETHHTPEGLQKPLNTTGDRS
jgi:hypothetical protein